MLPRLELVALMCSLPLACSTAPVPVEVVPPVPRSAPVEGGGVLQPKLGEGDFPTLPFTITAVHEASAPTDTPPWYGEGGEWTFFDAVLADGTAFVTGWHVTRVLQGDFPMTLLDVRLGVASPEQGARFTAAFAAAFRVTAPRARGTTKTGILACTSVLFGGPAQRNADGSFSGSGTWTSSKWTVERGDHSEEIFVNYSLEERRGELSEKDSDYDADLVKDFAEVLRDGQP